MMKGRRLSPTSDRGEQQQAAGGRRGPLHQRAAVAASVGASRDGRTGGRAAALYYPARRIDSDVRRDSVFTIALPLQAVRRQMRTWCH